MAAPPNEAKYIHQVTSKFQIKKDAQLNQTKCKCFLFDKEFDNLSSRISNGTRAMKIKKVNGANQLKLNNIDAINASKMFGILYITV